MASKPYTYIKQLQPPRQRILYDKPLTDIITNKKIKLHTRTDAFIFYIANQNNIYLDFKNKRTNINKLLKQYTQEEDTQTQFISLLKQPQIIQDAETTLFVIEALYISCKLLCIDLTQYITFYSLNNLINYYFIKHRINRTNYNKH